MGVWCWMLLPRDSVFQNFDIGQQTKSLAFFRLLDVVSDAFYPQFTSYTGNAGRSRFVLVFASGGSTEFNTFHRIFPLGYFFALTPQSFNQPRITFYRARYVGSGLSGTEFQ